MGRDDWKSKVIIYADVREERSGIPDILRSSNLMVVLKQLSLGDYVVSDQIVVERKSASDFARSLFDGRLFDQARRLTEHYPIVIYVVEGNPLRLYRYRNKVKQLTAAISSLIIDFNSRVIYSEGPWHTAMIIESLAKRVAQTRRSVVLHKKPKLSSTREWQLYIVESFPGIGPKTAERILEAFGSIERFVNASIVELSKIPGIGEKKAETIKRILKSPYKPGGRKRGGTLEDFVGGVGED
ncbi:MAG: helix-hairpin-helix domain-containing protein [Desulfurococcales archaeon]|nr:helix-hairpin-helix domain-containing protein [Desulfurococcales archaeon]MCE4621770.1 helix-hairpin-helix domain-containing protein [Desulfurococcales archaeon]MCE4626583.1 helix-hairpin-helix domain-containing protein [Desulfurococcales archaeon]MCE4629802.1 helix-hairpin-helix domain-containing protein [Desulfurococcales archaeon]